jgi:hypothetical protein
MITLRNGTRAAATLGRRWNLVHNGARIKLQAPDIHTLYHQLIQICYLTPLVEKLLPLSLWLFNLRGRLGLVWLRRRLRRQGLSDVNS